MGRYLVQKDEGNTCDPPEAKERAGKAQGGEHHGGGGPARRESPACAFVRGSRHRSGGKRSRAHAQCTGKVERSSGGVVLRYRGAAMAERRRRNAGGGARPTEWPTA